MKMGKSMMQVLFVAAMALLSSRAEARLSAEKKRRSLARHLQEEQVMAVGIILAPPVVEIVGDEGEPADAFPLAFCQGDCDTDEDCSPGLVCFQRTVGEDVPGCVFGGNATITDEDICVFPAVELIGMNSNITNPTDDETSGMFPLQLCQGDCDDDSQCGEGLACYFRASKMDPAPGCSGIDAFNEEFDRLIDFCVPVIYKGTEAEMNVVTEAPTIAPTTFSPAPTAPVVGTLNMTGDDGDGSYPLQVCEGDCDTDDDCDAGLMCHQRISELDDQGIEIGNLDEIYTICAGEAMEVKDYCIPTSNWTNPNLMLDAVDTDETIDAINMLGDGDAMDTPDAMDMPDAVDVVKTP